MDNGAASSKRARPPSEIRKEKAARRGAEQQLEKGPRGSRTAAEGLVAAETCADDIFTLNLTKLDQEDLKHEPDHFDIHDHDHDKGRTRNDDSSDGVHYEVQEPVLPLDWTSLDLTLKRRAHFLIDSVKVDLSWARCASAISRSLALCPDLNRHLESDDVLWSRSLIYHAHTLPQVPVDAERWGVFRESFRSLYYAYRHGYVASFYLRAGDFTVLWRSEEAETEAETEAATEPASTSVALPPPSWHSVTPVALISGRHAALKRRLDDCQVADPCLVAIKCSAPYATEL